MNTRQLTLDLMYLVRCALHNESPDRDRAKDMDLPGIFQLARSHSMAAITWAGLDHSLCPPDLAAQWKEAAEMATRKALLLDIGREEIFAALENAGIWYLPLKGSLLQDLYPAPGLREMSDNDILFDRTRRQEVMAIMQGLGYKVDLGNLDSHDIYTKPPVYNYEMHLTVMGEKYAPRKIAYYSRFQEKLLDHGDGSAFRFIRDEDFYIFMVAHAHNHYTMEGIGLRMFADIQVWLEEKENSLDWDYITGELETLGIRDFDAQLRQVTGRLFQDPKALTPRDWEMVDFCTSCGTHGTYASQAQNRLRALQSQDGTLTLGAKVRYLWRRLCPDQKTCQLYFPFFAKYPFLKPFFVLYRIFRALLLRRDMVAAELGAMAESQKP